MTGDEIHVQVDPDHGGRWTSLQGSGGREWLWRRDAPERERVHPGDPFVDAGGLEECFPTLGGPPDHGDAWSRRWVADGDWLVVEGADYQLRRRIVTGGATLTADYRVVAAPGYRFIWTAHALLRLSTAAMLLVPDGHPTLVHDGRAEHATRWPRLDGTDLSTLGPADGTALMILLRDLSEVTVVDGPDRLTMSLASDDGPRSIAVWRNLGGWPDAAPYRSIGVEPMIGRAGALSVAGPDQAAVVGAGGSAAWTLTIATATSR